MLFYIHSETVLEYGGEIIGFEEDEFLTGWNAEFVYTTAKNQEGQDRPPFIWIHCQDDMFIVCPD